MASRYFRTDWRSGRYPGVVTRCAWSPAGDLLAVPVHDGRLELRRAPEFSVTVTEQVSHKALWVAGWSPSGRLVAVGGRDNTAHVYEAASGGKVADLAGHIDDVHGLTWAGDEDTLVTASYDGTLRVWDIPSARVVGTVRAHDGRIQDVAWDAESGLAVTSGRDGRIRLWDLAAGRQVADRLAHDGFVLRLCAAKRSRLLLSASSDATVKVWDRDGLVQLHVIRGFTGTPHDLSLSAAEDLLAVKDDNRTVRVYRLDTFELVDEIEAVAAHRHWYGGAAFHPSASLLAVTCQDDRAVEVLEFPRTLAERSSTEAAATRYANCRVGVLGNTGVGKTALAAALRGEAFAATESTHGTKVSLLARWTDREAGDITVREVYLWDFAGQPLYRLMQRVEVADLAVALLVLDSRNATDPVEEIREWETLLSVTAGDGTGAGPHRILVVARADRGAPAGATLEELRASIEGCTDAFATSAKEHTNIDEVRAAILRAIRWDDVPTVSSDEQFQRVRMFLRQAVPAGPVIRHASEMQADYEAHCIRFGFPVPSSRDFRSLLTGLESEGLLRRLGFGDFVLLQPAMLTSYASMVLLAAERSPRGDGQIEEEDLALARLPLLAGERIGDARHERVLLYAAERQFLDAGVVLRESEPATLQFPSAVRRQVPSDRWTVLDRGQCFDLRGILDHAYASLVVLLQATGLFAVRELWHRTARFGWPDGPDSWLRARADGSSGVVVDIRHDRRVGRDARALFENLCRRHLARLAVDGEVGGGPPPVCGECATAVAEDQARRRLARGHSWIRCNVCDGRIDLVTVPTPVPETSLRSLERNVRERRDEAIAAAAISVKDHQDLFDVFISYAHVDRESAVALANLLRDHGLRPWIDVWELAPGKPWLAALQEQIETVPAAAVLVGPSGVGPWQTAEANYLLQQFFARRCPVVPVLLPGGGTPESRLPSMLAGMQAIDLSIDDPDPIRQLIWGITGKRP